MKHWMEDASVGNAYHFIGDNHLGYIWEMGKDKWCAYCKRLVDGKVFAWEDEQVLISREEAMRWAEEWTS